MMNSLEHKRVCFLSIDSLEDFVDDDDIAVEELQKRGCMVEYVNWQATNIDWDQFDLVVIRSTWNYQNFRDEFLNVLAQVENSSALLINSLEVVRWNIDKQYLLELKQLGIEIVPTTQFDSWQDNEINSAIKSLGTEKFVLKPRVSANADDTFLIARSTWNDSEQRKKVSGTFSDRGLILQPFVSSIATDGEYSVFFMGNEFTHAISKKPKSGDFRVQEEHGGIIESIDLHPFLESGSAVMERLPFKPHYARLDFVDFNDKLCIMEIELIEPSLYFRFSDHAATRFAETISNCLAATQ